MIAAMDRTKVIFVQRKRAPTFSSHVHAPATASRSHGCATATTIASTNKTKKTVRQYRVWQINSSAPICGSASKSRTNVTASQIATMAATNWAAHRWDPINAIRRSNSDANHLAFVFRSLGTVTAPTTVTTIPMKRNAERFRARLISTNATIRIVCSKRTFAMAKMIVATIVTKARFMHACRRHSDARPVNGCVQALQAVAST